MKIHAEMLVGLSAVVIGVCALGVSLYETKLMREEQRAAVLPMLELARSHYIDGEPHPTWHSAMQALIGRDINVSYGQSSINGRTIPAERQVKMFDLSSTEFAAQIMENFDRLEFEACFCSVFDECWTTSFSSFGNSTPIEACVATGGSFTE